MRKKREWGERQSEREELEKERRERGERYRQTATQTE